MKKLTTSTVSWIVVIVLQLKLLLIRIESSIDLLGVHLTLEHVVLVTEDVVVNVVLLGRL